VVVVVVVVVLDTSLLTQLTSVGTAFSELKVGIVSAADLRRNCLHRASRVRCTLLLKLGGVSAAELRRICLRLFVQSSLHVT